jgi:hypothetical protein
MTGSHLQPPNSSRIDICCRTYIWDKTICNRSLTRVSVDKAAVRGSDDKQFISQQGLFNVSAVKSCTGLIVLLCDFTPKYF